MARKPTDVEPLYLKHEVQGLLGISPSTLDRLMRSGRLAYTKVGRTVRFTQTQLDVYLDHSRRERAS